VDGWGVLVCGINLDMCQVGLAVGLQEARGDVGKEGDGVRSGDLGTGLDLEAENEKQEAPRRKPATDPAKSAKNVK